MEHYARWISKFRYVVLVVWVAATVGAMFLLPSLQNVVAHQSTNFLADSTPVVQAGKLLDQIHPGNTSKSSAVLAIHDANGLSAVEKDYFQQQLTTVDAHKRLYGVTRVQDAARVNPSAASVFFSKDGTTEIALVDFPGSDISNQTATALSALHHLFATPPSGAQVEFTGDAPIQQDDTTISQKGVSKTAGVTVVLVLVILLLVFRSIVAPLVTLVAIGLSFLLSSSVVAWLAGHGLPVSNFTETFLVAVLFGAGTDYSIIIMNRYREAMSEGQGRVERLATTLRSIGKTVIFSSLTVLVSFAVLYFANFGLYRSAVGVAVGIFITLLCCLTFVPALMDSLQGGLYWPRKIRLGQAHAKSKLWHLSGGLSIRKPWWVLLSLSVVFFPIALLFTNQRSFNPMDDIPSAPSVQGFKTVANAFGPGHVLPMNIVIHTDHNLRSPQGLATIANVTHAIATLPSVDAVQSATQPAGLAVTSFQLANQNVQAAVGLSQVGQGLSTLANQLVKGSQLAQSAGHGTQSLVSGAGGVALGAAQLNAGLQRFATDTGRLAAGGVKLATSAAGLQQGLLKFNTGLLQVSGGAGDLVTGLNQTSAVAMQLADGAAQVQTGTTTVNEMTQSLANAIAAWTAAHPNDATNPAWQQIEQMAQTDAAATQQSLEAVAKLQQGTQGLTQAFPGLVQGAKQVQGASSQLATVSTKLVGGANQFASGAAQFASGVKSAQQGAVGLASGSTALVKGSQQIAGGVASVQSGFGPLALGMQQAAVASQQLQQGVAQVADELTQSKLAATTGNPGFYVPPSELPNAQLQQAMNAYISPDGHVANITVVLKADPYALDAMNSVAPIQSAAQIAFNSSPIHAGTVLSAGTSAVQATLNQVSNADFIRTVISILLAVFILLILMLRSILTPLYILASLTATYGVTMGILQTIALHVLHKAGLSWPVPFFVFLLLVALGVDYSMFLFSRFEEELGRGFPPKEAMHRAMQQMGNVIFSAALIMGGTFGSMMVAGVTSLFEIGLGVVVGLFVYAFVFLGLFVPAWASVIGHGHHWPFAPSRGNDDLLAKRNMPVAPTVQG